LTNATVWGQQAQVLGTHADYCLARAFAPAATSWDVAAPLLADGGSLIYWAGRTFEMADVPPGVRWRRHRTRTLESSGPLVMMTRQ
jgi:hypothetical protein